ncbi:MAG: ABC transporter ATP-binding protein [Synergistaceae bacterium]|jgi:iron complex transport system ATP-binding protein|nr:ABC transporter ATP-binding protein [Synergistaceae bacterium]
MDLIVGLENLSCGYGGRTVVASVSAEVASGEIFCLLGPNGIGKTTLFKTVLGLIPPIGGRVFIGGRNAAEMSPKEIARVIGYVPQSRPPPFAFKVSDVIVMGRISRIGAWSAPGRTDHAAADSVMTRLGIDSLRDKLYTELSGGERQMVLFARALVCEPSFLMMDEPTSNLDFGNQAVVLSNIRSFADGGMGVIMTSHFPEHAFLCGAKVALMGPEGGFQVGDATEVITEKNMSAAYESPVAVARVPYRGIDLHCCQPILKRSDE